MPVSIGQFSNFTVRRGVRDNGVVTLDARQNVRLKQSRFHLVRWIRSTGIGRRAGNRRTVNGFIDSLRNHYGSEVTSRMDLRGLRDVQNRGKPLHVRHVKAAIREADMVVDNLKMVKSSKFDALIDESVAASTYTSFPGGEELAAEVRSKVDVGKAEQQFVIEQDRSADMSEPSGETRLDSARVWASEAVRDAQMDVFLTGYGVRTAGGLDHGKLQAIVDEHSLSHALEQHYGYQINVSRASRSLQRNLTRELSRDLSDVLEHPERLSGAGTVKERVEEAIGLKAQQVVDDFLNERVQALEQLHEMYLLNEVKSNDMASYDTGDAHSLADVVLHHRIPAGRLRELVAARNDVPDNLGDLAALDRDVEDKLQILQQLGRGLSGIDSGIPEAVRDRYLDDEEGRQIYLEDCGRFLLEGKMSADDESTVRLHVKSDPPGSNLLELCNGIASMNGAAVRSGADRGNWDAARPPLEDMTRAMGALLGADAARLGGAYTTHNARVLAALRNRGVDVPPPDNFKNVQMGKGVFSRWAHEIAQQELLEDLADDRKAKSAEYPEFLDEATRDYGRATYIIGDSQVEYGDTAGVVEAIRNFCTDNDGHRDEAMVDCLSKLAYQRSNNMVYSRFSAGMDVSDADKQALVKSAPIVGMPLVNYSSTYRVSRTGTGNVTLQINSVGPTNVLTHRDGMTPLDPEQSTVAFNIGLEIEARDHTARVTGMDYEFSLVPTDSSP